MITATIAPALRQSLDPSPDSATYPEKVSFGQQPKTDELIEAFAQKVERQIVTPLLEGDDLEEGWSGFLDIYGALGLALVDSLLEWTGADNLQRMVEEAEKELDELIGGYAEERLGEKPALLLKYALDLKSIVCRVTLDSRHIWDESELGAVSRQLMAHGMCTVAVAHYILNGTGRRENAKRLASWSFHYADFAYLQCGLADSNHDLGTLLKR
jgi:hypothetical protein